jgi:hypothetical protein
MNKEEEEEDVALGFWLMIPLTGGRRRRLFLCPLEMTAGRRWLLLGITKELTASMLATAKKATTADEWILML